MAGPGGVEADVREAGGVGAGNPPWGLAALPVHPPRERAPVLSFRGVSSGNLVTFRPIRPAFWAVFPRRGAGGARKFPSLEPIQIIRIYFII